MTVDLENRIREALRQQAEEVTPTRLRFADAPRSATSRARRRGMTTWLAPAAIAACVVAVAVTIAVVAAKGGTKQAPAGGGGNEAVTALAGTAWRLDSVRRPGGHTIVIPQRLGAGVAFERDQKTLGADDGINHTTATYDVASTGDLVVTSVGTTLAGYAGHDPAVLAAIDGTGAITNGRPGQSTPNTVAVEIEPRLLRLSADGFVLTFVDRTPVATSAPASATATGAAGTASAVATLHS